MEAYLDDKYCITAQSACWNGTYNVLDVAMPPPPPPNLEATGCLPTTGYNKTFFCDAGSQTWVPEAHACRASARGCLADQPSCQHVSLHAAGRSRSLPSPTPGNPPALLLECRCYAYSTDPRFSAQGSNLNKANAQAACAKQGGFLVTYETYREQEMVRRP